MNNSTDPFELLECSLNKIVIDPQNGYVVSLLVDDEEVATDLNHYDATILTFVDYECAKHAHIHIVHQILLKFKQNLGFELSRVIIEAKYGDVVYCRLHWTHPKRDIYNVCSLGDALIFHRLTECELCITRSVFEQLESFDTDIFYEGFEDH